MPANSDTNNVTREARRDRVMELAVKGLNDRQIAEEINTTRTTRSLSKETIRKDRLLRMEHAGKKMANSKELLTTHKLRYVNIINKFYCKALDGNVKAAAVLLNGMARFERVMGWQQPKRVALGGDPDGHPLDILTRDVDLSQLSITELELYRTLQVKIRAQPETE